MKRIGLFALFLLFFSNSAFVMESSREHVSDKLSHVLDELARVVVAVSVQVTSLEQSLTRLEQQRAANAQRLTILEQQFGHHLWFDLADWEHMGEVLGDVDDRFRLLEHVALLARPIGRRRNSWP